MNTQTEKKSNRGTFTGPSPRIASVDTLRGLVMVLMVLDHTRDHFGDPTLNATDLARSTPALFMTRWITHFCAPVFALLAGAGAYLAGSRSGSRVALAKFLFARGVCLIFLELSVVRLGLFFDPVGGPVLLTVLWSLGASFVVLSGLIFLPGRIVGAIGILLITTHGFFNGSTASAPASAAPVAATVLLRPGFLELARGVNVLVAYLILPWLGIVAAGYGFGEVFHLEPRRRRWVLGSVGIAMTALFISSRAATIHGDPSSWKMKATPVLTAPSFINCTKQPPSPLFVLMMLGPAMAALTSIDRLDLRGLVGRVLMTFGCVPP